MSLEKRRAMPIYSWGMNDTILWLMDEGKDYNVSLTVRMEDVLQSMLDSGIDILGLTIVYRDRYGKWDGIRIRDINPVKLEFIITNKPTMQEALNFIEKRRNK